MQEALPPLPGVAPTPSLFSIPVSPPIPTDKRGWGGDAASLFASNAPVLLVGGTREQAHALARRIHEFSSRSKSSFVVTRCGLFRAALLESRFFGRSACHNRAFVRRTTRQPGHVEAADGGTLFIEHLQHAPPIVQNALVRLLSGRIISDPATGEAREANVRFIASVPLEIEVYLRVGRILPILAECLATARIHVPSMNL